MLSALERDISCTGWGWQVGHPWVGERVRHVFPPQRARGKRRGLDCTATCWLPPCGGRPALWRVESGSGECEDLEEGVLATALAQQGERGGTGDRQEPPGGGRVRVANDWKSRRSVLRGFCAVS